MYPHFPTYIPPFFFFFFFLLHSSTTIFFSFFLHLKHTDLSIDLVFLFLFLVILCLVSKKMEELLKILNEMDILATFVSMSWFGFEFWFWIFWIYAWICAIVLLILCLCLNGFVYLSLFFCVSELVLLCSLNGFSVRFGLVLLNKRRFMGLCSYILEHVVFVLWVCCVWFWIFWGKKNHNFFFVFVLKKPIAAFQKCSCRRL